MPLATFLARRMHFLCQKRPAHFFSVATALQSAHGSLKTSGICDNFLTKTIY